MERREFLCILDLAERKLESLRRARTESDHAESFEVQNRVLETLEDLVEKIQRVRELVTLPPLHENVQIWLMGELTWVDGFPVKSRER